MQLLISVIFLFSSAVWAESSKVIPVFLEAAEIYSDPSFQYEEGHFLRPELLKVINVLKDKKIDPSLLKKYTEKKPLTWNLPEDDQYDAWIKDHGTKEVDVDIPELALHAIKIDVIKSSDIWKDDVYAYFFITDGVIPTGKVTTIYKGIGSGQGFFFNELDRAIFPLLGVPSKKPENHLIVDYGIIESDGDDIKKMQQLSSIIIDIAIAVYSAQDPQHAQILVNLRKEIKALADMLLALNSDDRLVTSSFGFKAQELADMLATETFVEFKKKHKKNDFMNSWEYEISFRLLRK